MDCRKVQGVIMRYICGETTEDELRVVKAQLEISGSCPGEAEVIDGMLRLVKSVAQTEPIPEGARDRILGRLHSKVRAGTPDG